jgi:hypothetical protein
LWIVPTYCEDARETCENWAKIAHIPKLRVIVVCLSKKKIQAPMHLRLNQVNYSSFLFSSFIELEVPTFFTFIFFIFLSQYRNVWFSLILVSGHVFFIFSEENMGWFLFLLMMMLMSNERGVGERDDDLHFSVL